MFIQHVRLPFGKEAFHSFDASARPAAKGIAQSTLIEYTGSAHGSFATKKERLSKDLPDFIGG